LVLYSDNCPLFPRTKLAHNKDFCFEAQGLEAIAWKSAAQIREIFKNSFAKCGFPYYNPHSFTDTLSMLGKKTCIVLSNIKLLSQNLGHSKMSTTLDEYDGISTHRQFELIGGMKSEAKLIYFDYFF
jgi:integrase/recombinase XerD